ncbi:MAG: CPBP family intramembrane metalloprotease [Candidatus Eisenbacteria bacterium]|nr:CPBP family intramembrane metalloprotease [Candidatus Eisenbacteria bacterium]
MSSESRLSEGTWLSGNRRAGVAAAVVPFLLLGLLEHLPGTFIPGLAYFAAAGVWALYVTPRVLGLPNGRKPLGEYCADIRLLPVAPLARNILLGLLMAALTLSSILVASLLTKHFVLDWSLLPPLRWVKGLTRGVWEEVFFRGIALAILLRFYTRRKAVLWMTAIFAIVHINVADMTLWGAVDIVSIFFMGLLFALLVLRTGSLLPAIVFHYVHDVFVLLVQNTPGADEATASILLYGFLWAALAVGALFVTVGSRRRGDDLRECRG